AQICHAGAGATPADKPTLHVAISYESIADSKPFFRDFPKAKAGIDEAVAKVKNGGKFFTGIGNLEKYIDFTP
ncbi:MAG: hypothetical protein LBB38_03015, partial [Puniceicoccales bacterium]|nr:hypothetical protein [Puniceicoccales bacterium]